MRVGMDESPVIFEADCIGDTSSAEASGSSTRTEPARCFGRAPSDAGGNAVTSASREAEHR